MNRLFKAAGLSLFITVIIFSAAIRVQAYERGELPNQLVILYNSPKHDLSQLDIDKQVVKTEHVCNTVDVFHFKNPDDAREVMEKVSKDSTVAAVDYESRVYPEKVPNDTLYETYQDYLKNMGYEKIAPGTNSVKVAVLDTGVNGNHEDLIGRVEKSGYNYVNGNSDTSDLQGHGTFVSGIIAAQTNNHKGIAGACAQANVCIVPYTVMNSRGEGSLSDIAAALVSAGGRDDIKIINLSLGIENGNAVLENLVKALTLKGKIIIASSGNSNESHLMYPAGYDSVLSVGAVNEQKERCTESDWGPRGGSNYGAGLDVVAYGDAIASCSRDGRYTQGSGTSFSAPLISAACAIACTRDENVNTSSVREGIKKSAEDLLTPGWDRETGYGLLHLDTFTGLFGDIPVEPEDIPATDIEIDSLNSIFLTTFSGFNTHQIKAHVIPEDSTDKLTYQSRNKNIASVSESGLVTGKKKGTTSIILKAGTIEKEISVSVLGELDPEPEIPATGILLDSDDSITLTLGSNATSQIQAQVKPENSTDELSYKSKNTNIATVDASGLVTAKQKGTTSIILTAGTITKEISVTVLGGLDPNPEVPATDIVLSSAERVTLTLGSNVTSQIRAQVKPENSTDELSYESKNTSIAIVSSTGLITAKQAGTAEITLRAGSITKRIYVTVEKNVISQPNGPSNSDTPVNPTPTNYVEVYRVYQEEHKEHLYTTSSAEVESLTRTQGWKSEGVGWLSPNTGKAVYRLYNPTTQYHLYTTDENEVLTLTTLMGWTIDFDGKALFYSGGSKPVYRLYHEGEKVHHLTTDENEYNILGSQGWNQEGIAFYSAQ